jgi:hypothetical protein
MIKIASFNVENLFARPKAFRDIDPATEQPVLEAFREVNELIKKQTYTQADKDRMRDLLVVLEIRRRTSRSWRAGARPGSAGSSPPGRR